MAYLGKTRSIPAIDSQLISDSVSAGFDRALEALVPDPVTGEMVFDDKIMDKILWESEHQPGPNDGPTYKLPADPEPGRYYPLAPTSDGSTPPGITSRDRPQYLTDPTPQPDTSETSAAEPETSTGNGGGGMFPLIALGLLAYLGSQ